MTDEPVTPPETTTPEVKARRRRSLAFWLLMAATAALVLVIVALGVGRYGVLSPAGRDLVSTFVNGKKLGRYGRINVYGLKGDLWDRFSLDRVTVTDAKGVWLDARDVRVDWTYTALVQRRFHADMVSARTVRLLRRPQIDPQIEPPKPMPLSIDIDRFFVQVELMEGFSKEYGRWAVTGEADIARAGAKAAKVKAISLSRPGDYLSADAVLATRKAPRVNLVAFERRGGPLAGALGYSPDRPFVAAVRSAGEEGAGVFGAVVRTGTFEPLRAGGTWGKENARASGYVSFAGSDLFDGLARRFGTEAAFGLAARKARGDDFGLGVVFRSDNLSARARGLVSRKTMRSVGPMPVDFTTASATQLAGLTVGGAGAFEGEWSGDPRRWRLRGNARLEQPQLVGVKLARLSGPVDLVQNRGRWDIDGDLDGVGAGGPGVIPRLLGARPEAHVEVARLTDGRWLFERLQIDGAAGRVDGTGSRGLTGGLSFRGKADLTNIAVMRKGARGALGGTFDASQSRSGQPWTISFDARGRKFASGLAQLDRLLGPEPRLQASGAYQSGTTSIREAVLNGKAGRMSAKGLLEPGGRMRLALDWTARGPFQAGPVEIAGDASGSGALTGTFSEPRADLKAKFAEIDVGPMTLTQADVTLSFTRQNRAYDGRIAVTSGSNYGPAEARSAFRFIGDGVRLDELFVDAGGLNARGSLALQGRNPSSADLTFMASAGAFVESGFAAGRVRLTDGPSNAEAIIDVTGENLRFRGSDYLFRALRLSGRGTLSRLPFIVSANVAGAMPVKFEGQGVYARQDTGHTVSLSGDGQLRRAVFRTLQPAVVSLSGENRTAHLDLGFGNGRLLADARQTAAGFDARADLTGVDLGAIGEDFAGRINGVLVMSGRGERLAGSLDATLEDARSTDGPRNLAVDGSIRAQLTDNQLRVVAAAFDEGGVRADTTLVLPVEASAAPLRLAVVRNRPMSGEFSVKGEIKPVWDLVLGGDQSLGGQVDANGRLSGTLNDPLIQGGAAVANGRFDDASSGVALRALTLDATFERNVAVIRQFSANDGRSGTPGTVTGQGRLEFRSGGASSFDLTLDRFEVIDNDIATARASGPVRMERAADGRIRLTGDLLVNSAEIAPNPPTPTGVVRMDVVEINRPIREDSFATRTRPRGPGIALDIKLRAPRNVIISGRGLDVDMSVNAHVTGTTANPVLTGQARIVRGDYEFAGKRFIFDDTGGVTLSTRPEDIRLDLRAVREDPSLTAVIRVTGTAARPQLTLTSQPVLPQDEILAQILFGRSASQLSGVEAAQLASSVASVAGGGGFDVIGNLRELAGLDRLAFGSDEYGMTVA
ncbi:translocation/assembly module TamB domain-containing protein, partial [Brevundimonas sp.]|uniref:translocation/assembly module TamB domain-containing protein n=1 Tax=Brevundimonas sp. TaxID=1871086 RepID=UPI002D6742AA